MEKEIENIVNALVKKSKEGHVLWNLTSNKEEFKLQLSDATLCVSKRYLNGGNIYILQIYNSNGDSILNQSIRGTEAPNIIKNLYLAAKDAYFQKDKTIQSIWNQVNTDGLIGNDDGLPF